MTEKERKSETWIHKVKCMSCGLHFMAASWERDWNAHNLRFCPECGERDAFLIFEPEASDKFIFQIVPGEQSLVSMGASFLMSEATESE